MGRRVGGLASLVLSLASRDPMPAPGGLGGERETVRGCIVLLFICSYSATTSTSSPASRLRELRLKGGVTSMKLSMAELVSPEELSAMRRASAMVVVVRSGAGEGVRLGLLPVPP